MDTNTPNKTFTLDEEGGRKMLSKLKANTYYNAQHRRIMMIFFMHVIQNHLNLVDDDAYTEPLTDKLEPMHKMYSEKHPDVWADVVDMFERKAFLYCTMLATMSTDIAQTERQCAMTRCHAFAADGIFLYFAASDIEDFLKDSPMDGDNDWENLANSMRLDKHMKVVQKIIHGDYNNYASAIVNK